MGYSKKCVDVLLVGFMAILRSRRGGFLEVNIFKWSHHELIFINYSYCKIWMKIYNQNKFEDMDIIILITYYVVLGLVSWILSSMTNWTCLNELHLGLKNTEN